MTSKVATDRFAKFFELKAIEDKLMKRMGNLIHLSQVFIEANSRNDELILLQIRHIKRKLELIKLKCSSFSLKSSQESSPKSVQTRRLPVPLPGQQHASTPGSAPKPLIQSNFKTTKNFVIFARR